MSVSLDTLIEQLNSLVVVVNGSGSVEYISPSVSRILGFDAEELMGNAWWSLTQSDSNDRMHDRMEAIREIYAPKKTQNSFERMLKAKNGTQKWILWNTTVSDADTLIGIGQDISERKQVEARMLQKNSLLEQRNKETEESIAYASKIQQSLLPSIEKINAAFASAFVLYEPRNIVSGDFYFFYQKKNKVFVAAIDCTGHGVPGALMSIIAHTVFNEVIVKQGLESAKEILYAVDSELDAVLNRENQNGLTQDGMDVALAVFDKEGFSLEYAGAFRTAFLFTKQGLEELPGSRYPIGQYQGVEKKFEAYRRNLSSNDTLYLFSDGFCDQFGGDTAKKFNRKRFKELLSSVQDMDLEEQGAFLSYALRNWRQEQPQTDDVLVIGLRV